MSFAAMVDIIRGSTASPPPPPRRYSADPVDIVPWYPCRPSVFAPDRPPWMSQLAEAGFNKACVADRVCTTCGGAAFCEHCCGDHHRGHDTSPAAVAVANGDHAAAAHRRDSFCIGCRVAFCSDLCAHHNAADEGHEGIPVVEHALWYCARCTGSEQWLPVLLDGVKIFRDENRNLLVPLHWKQGPAPECPAWFSQLLTGDFSKTCATDRVCNTCGGASFCEHCCGEHHRDHDTAAATDAKDKEPSAVHRRDSFCTGCRVFFCSDLCAHHGAGGVSEGHEVIPIVEHSRWYCARCTGTEPWFDNVLGGGQTFNDKHGNVLMPLQLKMMELPKPGRQYGVKVPGREECPPWMFQLLTANFCQTCAGDQVCNTCGGAAFCGHCCREHHRGHDTAAATAKENGGSVALSKGHRRDSFCTVCRVAFCSQLCAHHAGHEVIPIDAYGDRHFVRSTGSEPWFTPSAFGGIETFEDKDGNLMVPLQRKRSRHLEAGLSYRYDTGPDGEPTTPPPAANQSKEMNGGEVR
uniref:Uncharacterized protein n=1 Tax=Avena sativa TaxID=4498 RepID=A0ACD5U7P6_AVESA